MKQILYFIAAIGVGAALFSSCGNAPDAANADNEKPVIHARSPVDAGRYLVMVGACNDCHTPGYMEKAGKVPEGEWLTGVPIGFKGPWGTTYPPNLRLTVTDMSEDDWVEMVSTRNTLPPMPWFNLHAMNEKDQRAIYQYLKHLGPIGERAPLYVSPDREPETPYFIFEPLHLERLALLQKKPLQE